jgi:hypothetical protein
LKDVSNQKLNAAFPSSFEPGNWVKTIYFENPAAPDNLDNLDGDTDPFYEVMKRYPNVEEASFYEDDDDKYNYSTKNWAYFSAALKYNTVWKLRVLPTQAIWNEKFEFSYYHSCAYYIRNSLTELYLEPGVIDRLDYNRLSEFQVLTEFHIEKYVRM